MRGTHGVRHMTVSAARLLRSWQQAQGEGAAWPQGVAEGPADAHGARPCSRLSALPCDGWPACAIPLCCCQLAAPLQACVNRAAPRADAAGLSLCCRHSCRPRGTCAACGHRNAPLTKLRTASIISSRRILVIKGSHTSSGSCFARPQTRRAAMELEGRWRDLDRLLERQGNLVGPGFEPGPEIREFLQNDAR